MKKGWKNICLNSYASMKLINVLSISTMILISLSTLIMYIVVVKLNFILKSVAALMIIIYQILFFKKIYNLKSHYINSKKSNREEMRKNSIEYIYALNLIKDLYKQSGIDLNTINILIEFNHNHFASSVYKNNHIYHMDKKTITNSMYSQEKENVLKFILGHELSHILNKDLNYNTFTIFLAEYSASNLIIIALGLILSPTEILYKTKFLTIVSLLYLLHNIVSEYLISITYKSSEFIADYESIYKYNLKESNDIYKASLYLFSKFKIKEEYRYKTLINQNKRKEKEIVEEFNSSSLVNKMKLIMNYYSFKYSNYKTIYTGTHPAATNRIKFLN